MAEKKHQDLTNAEAQRLGALRHSDTAEALLVRAKENAQRRFAELEREEAAAAEKHLGPDVDGRGAIYRREQEAQDAQLVGQHPDPRFIRDATLRQRVVDARERIRRGNEVRVAPERVRQAQEAYDRAAAYVAECAAKVQRAATVTQIATLRAELGRTKDAARIGDLAAQIEKLEQEVVA